MKETKLILSLFLTAGSVSADTFVYSLSGTVTNLTVNNVPSFPSDITVGSSFSANFSYDLDQWEWYDFGSSYLLTPIADPSNYAGMNFTLEVGETQWEINGSEVTGTYFTQFLEIGDDSRTSSDFLKVDLGINNETPPSNFPFYLDDVDLDILMTDALAYDFIAAHGPASNSNVNLGNVDTQVFSFGSHEPINGGAEWLLDMEISSISFSTVPEPKQYALYFGILGLLAVTKRRSNKAG